MKYPRTPHFPGSHASDDDIVRPDYSPLSEPVVATEKMDGSNIMTSLDAFISRSGKTPHGEWVAPFWRIFQQVSGKIPENMWIAGEFLFWRKSIGYDDLPGYYLIFGAVKNDTLLSWDETRELAKSLGLPTVREIARGNISEVLKTAKGQLDETQEGFVVRSEAAFPLSEFAENVRKFVGAWHSPVETNRGRNGLA